MSLFSLNWFKKKKQEEDIEAEDKLDNLPDDLQKLRGEIVQEAQNIADTNLRAILEQSKPYIKRWLTNGTMGVITLDGDPLFKTKATLQEYEAVGNATTPEEVFNLFSSKEELEERKKIKEEYEKFAKIETGLKALEDSGEFDVIRKSIYLKGIKRSLPQLLVEKFISIISDVISNDSSPEGWDDYWKTELESNKEFKSLKNFWYWCCLNPRAEVADELYTFLMENSFKITKKGFFAALRNVVTVKNGSKELVEFISNSYNKIKAVWKKNPADYSIYSRLGDYQLISKDKQPNGDNAYWESVGNLKELYLDLPNMKENRYTDAHTGTFDIRVGKAVWMDPGECSWSVADCAEAGLHFTSNQINYVCCGDTSVLVLINPMKVVGIGSSKGRCYEYFPVMTVPSNEATTILHDTDFDTIDLDEIYADMETEDLENRAKEGFAKEAKKYEFNIPSITSKEIAYIAKSLENIKEKMKGRVMWETNPHGVYIAGVDPYRQLTPSEYEEEGMAKAIANDDWNEEEWGDDDYKDNDD